jgi:tetratricopeptide (TPR) repeat protein
MPGPIVVPLESIRTDGWFERIGEGIGSFQALCDIIGPRFFAFAMITGARITSLTVDRRNPDNTLVDFVVGSDSAEVTDADAQRLSLSDFRRRLVNALVTEDAIAEPPRRATDLEAVQLHIGVRYLLLAPLYGYALRELTVEPEASRLRLAHDGVEETYLLGAFRARMRAHVREELERVTRPQTRGAIELSRVAEAEQAAERGDHVRILELLGAWPAPLAIFLRTPEGQMLNVETRSLIAKALCLLGSACIVLGEIGKGEEVLRLGVQYAGDGPAASDVYLRLGSAILGDGRSGEAIGPLRRAANLGAPGEKVWPLLAEALLARGRYLAAFAAVEEARLSGVNAESLSAVLAGVRRALGPAFAPLEAELTREPS